MGRRGAMSKEEPDAYFEAQIHGWCVKQCIMFQTRVVVGRYCLTGRSPANLGPLSCVLAIGKSKREARPAGGARRGGKMVLVHVKAAAEELQLEFLYECPSSSAIDDVAESVADIHRLQSKILLSLSPFVRARLLTRASPESHPDPALVALERAVSEAEIYASKEQVLQNRLLSLRALRDHITSIEKALVLAQQEAQAGFDSEHQLHDRMQLWWAGKELASGKRLCDYIGPNEKTKIIIRLKPASTKA